MLFTSCYADRQVARRDLAKALELVTNTVLLLDMTERECELRAEELRAVNPLDRERRLARRMRVHRGMAALYRARANADEAELLLARAAGRFERLHVPASTFATEDAAE